jgi:spore maturation protein CgeB
VVVYRTAEEREELLDRAFAGSDWVIKCSGVGLWDRELEEGVAASARRGALTAFWDVDAPATLGAVEEDPDHPFARLIPRFDHVFTYGGGPPVMERYRRLGARVCTPVYNALDPEEHHPAEGPASRWDLLFMGNRLPDREARVEEFLLRAARLAPERRFALGGEGWSDKELPGNVEYLGHVPTAHHNQVNAAARLVLNVHRDSMVENGWSPATRMFEAAGAAACQVTDRWEGLADFFEPGREILVADGAEDVVRFVREVGEDEARRIGGASRRRALAEHTYDRRAGAVDAVLRAAAGTPA